MRCNILGVRRTCLCLLRGVKYAVCCFPRRTRHAGVRCVLGRSAVGGRRSDDGCGVHGRGNHGLQGYKKQEASETRLVCVVAGK
jgi:hypothetical protein